MKPDPKYYTNYSGGAEGADKRWKLVGEEFGVETIDYRPNDLSLLSKSEYNRMLRDVENAAKALGRPSDFQGVDLVRRNWLPVQKSQRIIAISYIIQPGQKDYKGFVNETDIPVVAGGTGWTVQLAIYAGKEVDVFDMATKRWFFWNAILGYFREYPFGAPMLKETFAGVGSRILTPEGVQAIRDVYEKTFKDLQS